jgi:two-component system sensor histidine kinase ChvG
MTDEVERSAGTTAPETARRWQSRPIAALRHLGLQTFSSLTRRIVFLNLAGLFALLIGILYLNQFREGLIDARVQALLTQGEIMASGIAASTTADSGIIRLDPERLLEMQAAEDAPSTEEAMLALDFAINPEKVAPLLRRLIQPTKLRARVFDRDGTLILDSRNLFSRGDIVRADLPPPGQPTIWDRLVSAVRFLFVRSDLPRYEELGSRNGTAYSEVGLAMNGATATVERVNDKGESIVMVAVPIQRFRGVLGVLLLSTRPGEIDAIVTAERIAILRVFLVASGVMVVLSLLLAGTIAGPVRRLAEAAERVRSGVKDYNDIPNFTDRADEIGHLSGALRDMTHALFMRIEAIESFAADVAHELKNPLTSLRSAVETLPLAKSDTSRGRLLEVIQHDVRRLDRLISDISDASRLDAEMQRMKADPVDVRRLIEAVAAIANGVDRGDGVTTTVTIVAGHPDAAYFVNGHDSRLAQVITNLVDNARSFSPRGGTVRITARRLRQEVEIVVDDDGPGIPEHAMQRIFERFYTDRPEDQGFGQNSGLGLSISRQIIEAHGGTIHAENRAENGTVLGARFVVRLPAAA